MDTDTVVIEASDGSNEYPLKIIAKLAIYDSFLFESQSPLVLTQYPLNLIDMVLDLNDVEFIDETDYLHEQITQGIVSLDDMLTLTAFVGARYTLELLFQYCQRYGEDHVLLQPKFADIIHLYVYSILDNGSIPQVICDACGIGSPLRSKALKGAAMHMANNFSGILRDLHPNVFLFLQELELTEKSDEFQVILKSVTRTEIPFRDQEYEYQRLLQIDGARMDMCINLLDGDMELVHRSDTTRRVTIKCQNLNSWAFRDHVRIVSFSSELDRLLGPVDFAELFQYLVDYWGYVEITTVLSATLFVVEVCLSTSSHYQTRSMCVDSNYEGLTVGTDYTTTNLCWYRDQKYKVLSNTGWWSLLIKLDDFKIGKQSVLIVSREHITKVK